MKEVYFYYDFLSPYAYLSIQPLNDLSKEFDFKIKYVPVVFGAVIL
jgi:2-hydroxychromene-2-carboxylate isomerase